MPSPSSYGCYHTIFLTQRQHLLSESPGMQSPRIIQMVLSQSVLQNDFPNSTAPDVILCFLSMCAVGLLPFYSPFFDKHQISTTFLSIIPLKQTFLLFLHNLFHNLSLQIVIHSFHMVFHILFFFYFQSFSRFFPFIYRALNSILQSSNVQLNFT